MFTILGSVWNSSLSSLNNYRPEFMISTSSLGSIMEMEECCQFYLLNFQFLAKSHSSTYFLRLLS